jgi:ring-1,2-phenylacetyl-CoA epoxidase subunit PaaE
MNMKVTKVIHETHDTDTFVMEDQEDGGRVFDYHPGQYLTFRFDDVSDKPVVRSYTMSSSPEQGDFSAFTVKRVEGGLISNWLCDKVKEGSILRARGPIGKFCYDPEDDASHLFMVAGGSGVTPFVSIMRGHAQTLGQPGSPKKMTLLVSYRTGEDLICWDDLLKLNAQEGINVITTLSRETTDGFWHGRIDEPMLARAIDGHYQETTYMTCGPIPMMDMMVAHCKQNGVEDRFIKLESFES